MRGFYGAAGVIGKGLGVEQCGGRVETAGHAADEHAIEGRGVEHVLLNEHAGGQAVLVVAGQHGHGGLGEDRAVVDDVGDDVDRAAMQLHAGGQGAAVGVQAGEGRGSRLGWTLSIRPAHCATRNGVRRRM